MLAKALAGGLAAAVLALVIVFWLLLSAKEANGVLTQGIESAKGVNTRQAAVQAELQANHNNLLVEIEDERRKVEIATDALELVRGDLVKNKADFDRRIRSALEEIPDEELVCAAELVPQALIDSLKEVSPSEPFAYRIDTLATDTMLISKNEYWTVVSPNTQNIALGKFR